MADETVIIRGPLQGAKLGVEVPGEGCKRFENVEEAREYANSFDMPVEWEAAGWAGEP